MAKKTLSSIKQCPIDFLYLWASEEFISNLGSRAKIIREKQYNQYQTLWKTMVENVGSASAEKYKETYNQWTKEIAEAIKSVYGLTPAQILHKLAMGEMVVGKDWNSGVYGDEKTQITFDQKPSITVDPNSGKILSSGSELPNQTAIYGQDGSVVGYSVLVGNEQFQSNLSNMGVFGAYTYSNGDGTIQSATGSNFSASKGSFWQNANNYMPIVEQVLGWITSLVSSFTGDRTVLTPQNTVLTQKEWVQDESDNSLLIAGGLAAAGLVLVSMEKPKKSK